MHYSAMNVVFLAIIGLSAALILPEDAPEGPAVAYEYNGTMVWDFQGPSALAGPPAPSASPEKQSPFHILAPINTPQCNGVTLSVADLQAAEAGLANTFGTGPFAWNARAMSFTSGSAVAYACNYGKGQRSSSSQFMNDMNNVDQRCGTNGAGWMGHSDWKMSYGRTMLGQGFC